METPRGAGQALGQAHGRAAFPHPGQHGLGVAHLQAQAAGRVPGQVALEQQGHDVGGDGGAGRQVQLAAGAAVLRGLGAGLFQQIVDAPGVAQQVAAGFGQAQPPAWRTNRGRPTWASSWRTWAVTAGWYRFRTRAAAEIWPSWATTRKVSRRRGSRGAAKAGPDIINFYIPFAIMIRPGAGFQRRLEWNRPCR